jgi:hypothetical protein
VSFPVRPLAICAAVTDAVAVGAFLATFVANGAMVVDGWHNVAVLSVEGYGSAGGFEVLRMLTCKSPRNQKMKKIGAA